MSYEGEIDYQGGHAQRAESIGSLLAENYGNKGKNTDRRVLQDPVNHQVHHLGKTFKKIVYGAGGGPDALITVLF